MKLPLKEKEMNYVCKKALSIFSKESCLVETKPPLKICGKKIKLII